MTHSTDYVPGDGPSCGEDQIRFAAQRISYGEGEIAAFFLLALSSSPSWLLSGWALTSPFHWNGSCQKPQCPLCCWTQQPFLISYSSSDGHNWSCPLSGNLLFPWPLRNHSHPFPPTSLEIPSPPLFLVLPPLPDLFSIYAYSLRWYTRSVALNSIYMLMTSKSTSPLQFNGYCKLKSQTTLGLSPQIWVAVVFSFSTMASPPCLPIIQVKKILELVFPSVTFHRRPIRKSYHLYLQVQPFITISTGIFRSEPPLNSPAAS